MNLRNLIFLLSICISPTFSALFANIEVLARFEPSRIALGSASKYIVEIIESDTNSMPKIERITSLPILQINDLALRNGSTSASQQTNILNGRTEYSITQKLIIDAIPASVGIYTLPGYQFEYKGTRLQVPAATLNVVERSADAGSTLDEMIFLDLKTPETLFVGQSVRVTLKLHVSENIQLRGLSSYERDADGFTVTGGPPEEAMEGMEIVNGRRYRTYHWPLTITPIRAGKQDLNFELGIVAQLPSQRSVRNGPFGNSIFDDFFGRSERLNLYTKPLEVNVRPLPTENQPETFSGAVGQFNMAVTVDNQSTRVGEPIMLSLKLSGQGNFDRIQGLKLPKTENWRNYPPESVFEPDESQPLKGAKRFDYVFIPEKPGTLEIPEISFSFFDPKVEKYIELTHPAIAVEVAPSERLRIPASTPEKVDAKNSVEPSTDSFEPINPEDLLLTLEYRPKIRRKAPEDSIPETLLYWINGALFIAFSAYGILNYRHRRLASSPQYQLVSDAKEELKTTLKAAQSDDPSTFFGSAQKAVRLAATIRLKQNLRTADFADLESPFRQIGLAETVLEQARALFRTAEAHRFSGNHATADLSEYRSQLKTVLNALS